MANLPISVGDYNRGVAKEPYIALHNRFSEQNPALQQERASFIARPGMRRWLTIGDGPGRRLYSQFGTFDNDLFFFSGQGMYRIKAVDSTFTFIGNTAQFGDLSTPSCAATARLSDIPEHLFIADGGILWLYVEDGYAKGTMTATGAGPVSGDGVQIGDMYYEFTNASVDVGTPDGTSGDPWLVALGMDTVTAFTNLLNAVNDGGAPGVDYSTGLTANVDVIAITATPTIFAVLAKIAGPLGDVIVTTATGADIAWDAGTLEDGGDPQITQVRMPDDVGAVSVVYINNYVIVVPSQGPEMKGRFYWINPGEIQVDPLDYATAERSPDPVHQVVVFGEKFWLLGGVTSEPWITAGDPDAPMQRFQGVLYDRGSWKGTAIQVKDSLILVDEAGGVFQIGDGQKRISRNDIAERVRRAIQIEASYDV